MATIPTKESERSLPKGLLLRGDTYHMRFSVKGVQVAETTHQTNLRKAEDVLSLRRAELIQQLVIEKVRPVKLHAAIDAFVKTRTGTAGHKNCGMHMNRFKEIDDKQLNRVEPWELNEIVDSMKEDEYALSTIQVAVNYFNAFVKWAQTQSYTACSRIPSIKGVKGKVRYLTYDEQTKLLNAVHQDDIMTEAKQDNYDLLVMLLDTGARYNEVARMQWHQVDFDKGQVRILRSKGGRDTTLTMTTRQKAMLLRRKAIDGHWVFASKREKNNNTHWMQRAVKRAGISTAQGSVNLHTCRHTFASTMAQNGVGLSEICHLLGHSSVVITAKYAHLIPQHAADKAAAVLNAQHA